MKGLTPIINKMNNKTIFAIIGLFVLISVFYVYGDFIKKDDDNSSVGLANPASVYCIEKGGRSEIRTNDDGGQIGFCIFSDDSECEEWAFFRNECVNEPNQGGNSILPFNSGVYGQVLLGPTCPVMREPPDPNCADKPYQTNVQVIAVGSPKSSPFATAETDKDGQYKFMLPPGEYSIQAIGGAMLPRCEAKTITVGPDEMINIDLACDSGIR